MNAVYDEKKRSIPLREQIATGGEGTIWRVSEGWVAKLYHTPDEERERKVEAMLAAPPPDPSPDSRQPAIAWPKYKLYDANGKFLGFEMVEIKHAAPLSRVYLPALRKQHRLDVDWRFLHAAALNVAAIMKSLHANGYVIGDVKPQNLLVGPRALVTITDTDSFQVPFPGGVFRCRVGSEGFTPPELIGLELAGVDQHANHDRFRLGVAVYLLLFGRHPYQGRWQGEDDPPTTDELVRRGEWVHRDGGRLLLPPHAPALAIVGLDLEALFKRCFEGAPPQRPEAAEWADALRGSMAALAHCPAGPKHFHRRELPCPWCESAQNTKVDLFATYAPAPPAPPDPKAPQATAAVVPAVSRSPQSTFFVKAENRSLVGLQGRMSAPSRAENHADASGDTEMNRGIAMIGGVVFLLMGIGAAAAGNWEAVASSAIMLLVFVGPALWNVMGELDTPPDVTQLVDGRVTKSVWEQGGLTGAPVLEVHFEFTSPRSGRYLTGTVKIKDDTTRPPARSTPVIIDYQTDDHFRIL